MQFLRGKTLKTFKIAVSYRHSTAGASTPYRMNKQVLCNIHQTCACTKNIRTYVCIHVVWGFTSGHVYRSVSGVCAWGLGSVPGVWGMGSVSGVWDWGLGSVSGVWDWGLCLGSGTGVWDWGLVPYMYMHTKWLAYIPCRSAMI